MRKQFSFKEYLVYALRFCWIAVICAVIGVGAALCASLLGKEDAVVRYEGQAEIAGITTLYPNSAEPEKETVSVYNTVCGNAIAAMQFDSNVTLLYNALGEEYCTIAHVKNNAASEVSFRKAFSFSSVGATLKVSFTMIGKKTDEKFCEKAVNEYLQIAIATAKTRETILTQTDGSIIQRDAEKVPVMQTASSYVRACVIGLLGGAVIGLVILLIIYAMDPRLASYRDIAAVTGKRLLLASSGEANESVCPKIDSIMQNDRVLLLCGDGASSARVALLYGKYVSHERGALAVLFGSEDKEPSSLAAFLGGQEIEACVEQEDGLSILRGGNEKLTLADVKSLGALTEKYGRVIFAKAYAADGITAVLAKIANKIVYAYDYKTACVKEVYALSAEMNEPAKAAGACIENIGKGFVGATAFIDDEEEEAY